MLGKHHSEETKRKISEAHLALPRKEQGKQLKMPLRWWQTSGFSERTHSVRSRRKMSVSQTGRRHSLATKAKIGAANSHREWSPESRERMACSVSRYWAKWPRPKTSLEKALHRLLRRAGFDFLCQQQFGRCLVDFYVPNYGLVFEADGKRWHQDKGAEEKRNEYLIEQGAEAVIHLTEDDLL